MDLRIAVLSDIHGNADALDIALDEVASLSPDLTVILGDLLTFGAQPRAVLDRLDTLASCVADYAFVSGNHDEFYFGLETGPAPFYDRVPPFVRESVHWTQEQIADQPALSKRYPWQRCHEIGPVFFAHANPYRYGDWTYVSSAEECSRAAHVLQRTGHRIGVFGHSHRAFAKRVGTSGVVSLPPGSWREIGSGETVILNPGSIGHPRGTGLTWLLLDLDGPRIRADIRPVATDLTAQRHALAASDMSLATRAKLLNYLEA